jgi:hypothetical protein
MEIANTIAMVVGYALITGMVFCAGLVSVGILVDTLARKWRPQTTDSFKKGRGRHAGGNGASQQELRPQQSCA